MNPFSWIYTNLVYTPQLNLLQFLYNITNDIGFSIIILAIVVNLLLWPLFANSYINSQKLRVLQPKLKEIQDKYKDNKEELFKQTMEFNKKHKINNGSIIWVLVGQLLIASGLWVLTNDVAAGKTLNGLYPIFFSDTQAHFSTLAFNFIAINKSAHEALWLPILNMVMSFLYGMYTFRWAPKPKIVEVKPDPKAQKNAKKDPKKDSAIDPAVFQRTLEFQTIYIMPIFLFVINLGLNVGVNIYFIAVSLMSLLRQVFMTNYYLNRTDKLIEEIGESDPSLNNKKDNDLDENDILELSERAVPALAKENLGKPVIKTSKGKKKPTRVKNPKKK